MNETELAKQAEIQAAYIKIARDRRWVLVVDVKDFDATQTSIIRIFKHDSGQLAIYAAKSTDGKTSAKTLASVLHSLLTAIPLVAGEVGCSEAAVARAVAISTAEVA